MCERNSPARKVSNVVYEREKEHLTTIRMVVSTQ